MIRHILTTALISITLISCANTHTARISFTGDIMMHGPVRSSALSHNRPDTVTKKSLNNKGYDYLFEKVSPALKDADLVIGNMEFPVLAPYNSENMIFNCSPHVLDALKKKGFRVLQLANNHILDQGPDGVLNSIKECEKRSIHTSGVARTRALAEKGTVITINGIRIGILSCTGLLNYPLPRGKRNFHINIFYEKDAIIQSLKKLKKRCDFCILMVHTGTEYKTLPEPVDSKLMKLYCDAGADLIVGHHPHVLQPVEKYMASDRRKCYIFYSMGNFISNQSGTCSLAKGMILSTRDSIILNLILKKNGDSIQSLFSIDPIFTRNTSENGTRCIQTVRITDELNNTADPKIQKILISKLKAIRWVLFKNRSFPEITCPSPPEQTLKVSKRR